MKVAKLDLDRLRNPRFRLAAVVVIAAAIAAVLVVASRLSIDETASASGETPAAAAQSPLTGIAQRGGTLGESDAPVTLIEYADLQCPFCAQWARETLPVLLDRYVGPGKLRIVFRGLAFIGPDSDKALRTAIAAGSEDHLWEIVHGLYLRQGSENAGWVTDELVREIAADVPGLDAGELLDARWDPEVGLEMKRAAAAARAAGVDGTPAFELGTTGGRSQLVQITSLGPEGIVPAIEAALADE